MSLMNCNCNCTCRCGCVVAGVLASALVGILTAFLQITGVITVTNAFLWVALGIAVVYLGVLVLAASGCCREGSTCRCAALNALLAGILGTTLFALVLLSLGVVAASAVSAILVGLLLFFLSLTLTGSACYVRAMAGCES